MSLQAVRKLMIADTREGFDNIRLLMEGTVAVVHAETLEHAVQMLEWKPDMIVCGLHFDGSRMFDLLRVAAADRDFKGKPILCYRHLDSVLPPAMLESLELACRVLGPARFVDLQQLKTAHGAAPADHLFRELVLGELG